MTNKINIKKLAVEIVNTIPTITKKCMINKYAYLLESLDNLPNGQMVKVTAENKAATNIVATGLRGHINRHDLHIGITTRGNDVYIFNIVE